MCAFVFNYKLLIAEWETGFAKCLNGTYEHMISTQTKTKINNKNGTKKQKQTKKPKKKQKKKNNNDQIGQKKYHRV